MLSRTAASLYWLGRYIERAEFTARLVEATLRLDALSDLGEGKVAWQRTLSILGLEDGFAATGAPPAQEEIVRFLTLDTSHSGSVVHCLDAARDNARAVRIALSRDAWSAINRAWLLFRGTSTVETSQAAFELVERAEVETRAFEGSIGRMLRSPASLFVRLGASVERADCTIRLLDAAREKLPQDPAAVVPIEDRDEWQMVLHAVSAVNAYRWLYREGLKPSSVFELLMLRRELPRSLSACAEEAVRHLNVLGKATGLQGEADRLARAQMTRLGEARIADVLGSDVEAFLERMSETNAALNRAIARQFRFH